MLREAERVRHQLVIEERRARFERMRHRELVDAHEQELGQPVRQLHVRHLLQEIRVRATLEAARGSSPETTDAAFEP